MNNNFNIAYMIMCHKNSNQVNRLISKLNSDYSVCFIHVDNQADFKPEKIRGGTNRKTLSRFFGKLFLDSNFR